MARLTVHNKQDAILAFIKEQVRRRGYPPSVREIGDAVGLASTSTVHSHLAKLEKRGLIRRDPTKPRAIEVTAESAGRTASGHVPLVSRVTTGAGASVTFEETVDYIPLPPDIPDDSDAFALRVAEDSMPDADIRSGDIVYVERRGGLENGDIVVALTDDGRIAIRHFSQESDRVFPQPGNAAREPSRQPATAILGRVVGLWRTLH